MKNKNTSTYSAGACCKLLLLLIGFGSMGTSYGQSRNEVSFHLKAPFSQLAYEVLQQNSELEKGFSFGAGYSYYLSDNWSVGTGAELQYTEGSTLVSSIRDAYSSVDTEGEEFEFRYELKDFREDQYAYFLNLPVQIRYETSDYPRFYAAGGVSVGFVLQSEYEAAAASLTTSGYYEQYDAELHDPLFAGFGDFGSFSASKSDLGLKTNVLLNLETGVKFLLNNNKALYLGLFLDYGRKDLTSDESQQDLIVYNNEDPTNFINQSLLNAFNNESQSRYAEEVKTIAFGLKLGYGIGF